MIGVITGAAKVLTVSGRIKQAKKEIDDVVRLAHKLIDKYEDVDDDVRQLKIELAEAVSALKKILSI
jgi:DNA anti-recombination protein RmuC